MHITLTGLIGTELFVYLDDIVIFPYTLEEHEKKFNDLIQRLQKANLYSQWDKYKFLRPQLGYFGHIIDNNGVHQIQEKIQYDGQ